MEDFPEAAYYNTFHKLGYTKTLSEKRIAICENFGACISRTTERNYHEGLQVSVLGSRGEGMAIALGSDFDVLYSLSTVKCFETRQLAMSKKDENDLASFQIDGTNSPAGYARLKLISIKPVSPEGRKCHFILQRLHDALIDSNGNKYLRNDKMVISAVEYGGEGVKRHGWVSRTYEYEARSGPAQPHRFSLPVGEVYIDVDNVPAFFGYYPSTLKDWYSRERSFGWPSHVTVDTVMKSQVLIVPTGEPNREDILNFRISFTLAQNALVQSFNDTQIKLYAALKMLSKHHLKIKCPALTSYVVKNVLFWVFETRQGTFEEKDFIELLMESFVCMKDGLNLNCIKDYIQPSRNLLKDRVTESEKIAALQCLDDMIQEGRRVLLRCPLVREILLFSGDEAALQNRMQARNLCDQHIYSYMSLPPELFDHVESVFHIAQTSGALEAIFEKQVFQIVKKSNPFNYFNLFDQMDDHSELRSRVQDNSVLKDGLFWSEYSHTDNPK